MGALQGGGGLFRQVSTQRHPATFWRMGELGKFLSKKFFKLPDTRIVGVGVKNFSTAGAVCLVLGVGVCRSMPEKVIFGLGL